MKCPFCDGVADKVVDSRESREGEVIRRRRECLTCQRRFTSYERVEEAPLVVVKSDGRREEFDRAKILRGLRRACEKRPVEAARLEALCDEVEGLFPTREPRELKTGEIGAHLMDRLREVDQVAFVRFASVYRRFEDAGDFVEEVETLLSDARDTARRIR
ncbi:MAG TPA: transcriptional regulator NrdR [Thermoanaerobaculia bacterium]|nr:transcriptional regulator NrdR [Thermoanaerobaculia bacterium]